MFSRQRSSSTAQTSPRVLLFCLLILATLLGAGLSLRSVQAGLAAPLVVVSSTGATGSTPSPTDNDYTRINNAVQAASGGATIQLIGTFNWTESNAAASWALGSDGLTGTIDDYSIYVPANLHNLTFTASALGAATIQGPGDLPSFDVEGVLFFDGGDNQNWTISNLRFLDFDLAIGMYQGAGGNDAFTGTKILNNYIRIPSDLNALSASTDPVKNITTRELKTLSAPADATQNIGILLSPGQNQQLAGNTIEFAGNGVSDSGNSRFSTEVGIQSTTTGGNAYDGLQITNNILRVLNAQSADPEIILGIWENAHGHQSNITVSGNQFINLAAGNNPVTNLQRAFRITSHSSLTTTVRYENNFVGGANIGFQWLAGQDFSGNQPVLLVSNNLLGNNTGVLIQSNGTALLKFNRLVGHLAAALQNATANAINAENNWWGCNFGPGAGGTGCAGATNGVLNTGGGSIDFNPWLVLELTTAPTTIPLGGTSSLTASLKKNSAGMDTSLMGMGTFPDGVTVNFAGTNGTVNPMSAPTSGGMAMAVFTATALGAGSAAANVDGQTVTQGITIICQVITVNPPSLPNGSVGTPYSQTFTQMGGTGQITWSNPGGGLPGGLMLNPSSGVLSGTPTTAGTFNFSIRATDANNCTGERSYSLIITPPLGSPGLQFYPLAHPVRLLDTRPGTTACYTPGLPIAGGTERLQPAQGTCAGLLIPSTALAITGNITTVNSGGGFLTLFPSNAPRPLVASSNYGPNEIVNNVFTVGLGPDGAFKIFAANTTDVVVDVTGYYAPPGVGGLYFHPLPKPVRLLETRPGQTGCFNPGLPLQGGASRTQMAHGFCDGVTIPTSAQALVGNATVVFPQGLGHLTLYPANAAQPLAASSNYAGGDIVNTPFTVGLSPAGEFKIFTFATTHLVVDVLGYYSPEASDLNGPGLLFYPLSKPVRLLDTRPGQVGCNTPGAPVVANVEQTQPARGACQGETIPATALGVVGTATVVFPNGNGFLTLWPSNVARPTVAALNYNAGQILNRHFTVGLGPVDGAFNIFSVATTHLVIDLAGYFAP